VPDNVHVPVPVFESVPVVVAIAPLSVPTPVPVSTKPNVFPVMPPLNVNAPVPEALIDPPLAVNAIARLVELPVPVY